VSCLAIFHLVVWLLVAVDLQPIQAKYEVTAIKTDEDSRCKPKYPFYCLNGKISPSSFR